jgi:3-oxoacyl-[acyl-carrier protein] reductase
MGNLNADLSGKLTLVTGSSKGIGRAIALGFAANGSDVVINYNSSKDEGEQVRTTAAELGAKAIAVKCDVTNEDQVLAMFKTIDQSYGKTPDILINNAGTQVKMASIAEMPTALWNEVMAINLTSAMLCARAACGGMKERKWGRIINMTSISGRSGGAPGGSHYASAKAGLISFSKALAKELAPFGITSNAIAPGIILTEQHEKFNTPEGLEALKAVIPLGYHGEPSDCVGTALFLASDEAQYITGAEIAINGGQRMN